VRIQGQRDRQRENRGRHWHGAYARAFVDACRAMRSNAD